MDRWSRTERLGEWLAEMGFFVEIVLDDKRPQSIDHLIVSADVPKKLPNYSPQSQG